MPSHLATREISLYCRHPWFSEDERSKSESLLPDFLIPSCTLITPLPLPPRRGPFFCFILPFPPIILHPPPLRGRRTALLLSGVYLSIEMSSSHHARASSLAGGHGGKVRGPESGRDATAACPVCAGAYQQTSWGSEDVSAGGGHGASFVRLCSLHQDASSLAAKSAHRGGPREGYTHAAADASFNSKTERESGSLRQSLHQHHRRCEDANQASADELGIALSSQYDDTDLGAGSASSRRRDESDAESLAYYEALADAVGDDHLHQAAAAGRSSSSARKNVQASRATTTAPSREHDSDMESDPDGGEDSSDDDRNRAEIRNGATQRRDRGSGGGGKGTRKSSKKGRKHRVELHSSDEEAEQPETKVAHACICPKGELSEGWTCACWLCACEQRAAREYMVGEIDERELAIGRRIAW